jgi:DNA-binding CsgD family transcriptional regulator
VRQAHPALLDHAERIASVGSWEWTPETGELVWSDNHFRLFGLEPGAVTPSTEFVVAMLHPDDVARVKEALTPLAAARLDERGLEYKILRADGVARTLRIAVVLVEGGGDVPTRIVGSTQDVTLERRVDRQLAARVAVTRALDAWASPGQGAHGLLAGLGTAMEAAFATLWVPDGSGLVGRHTWHVPAPALEDVAATTRRWRAGIRSATIGRSWASRRPVIPAHALEGGSVDRRAAIRRAALNGAIVVPAVSMDETLAVVELLAFQPIEPTELLVRALEGIGHELGHFLSHRRGELTLPSPLTPREREVLQLASLGRSTPAIAAELYLSPATVKRHFERSYAHLGVGDRAAAVGAAMRSGLIT